ncbi:hypothetical protein, partial [Pseudomonas aeruginosa]
EGVGSKAAALVDLSTVAGNKISNPPWVKFQSAGWVNFPSAPTIYDRYSYFDEKAVALSEWHAFLKGLLRKEFGDVDWVEFYGHRMEAMTPDEEDA